MEDLVFRDGAQLGPDELPAVLSVVHRSFPGSSQEVFTLVPLCRYGKVTVAYMESMPVCVLQLVCNWHDRSQAQFISVSVDPTYWGKGILWATLSHLLTSLPREGIRTVGIRVVPGNKAMWRVFVEKADFRYVREIKNCFGRGEDRLYLEKYLA